MTVPSNFEDEIKLLREKIKYRLNEASKRIVEEEIMKIIGRVKILKSVDLKDMQYDWIVESSKRENE